MAQRTTTSVIRVHTSNIERNPRQPRRLFNREELEQLTISVREHGIIQPLIVAPSGKRSLVAVRHANLETVPVIVRDVNDKQERLIPALVARMRKAGLKPCLPHEPGKRKTEAA